MTFSTDQTTIVNERGDAPFAPVRCHGCGAIRPNLEGPLIVDVGDFRHRVDFFCCDCVASGLCERRGPRTVT
jgi:hypothetical protein